MTQETNEMSAPMLGSHSELHRAVRALLDGVNARYAKNPREWTCPHMQALDDMTQSEPQPTLTDAEREAISASACICEDAGRTDLAVIINTALERLA